MGLEFHMEPTLAPQFGLGNIVLFRDTLKNKKKLAKTPDSIGMIGRTPRLTLLNEDPCRLSLLACLNSS